MPKVSPFDIWIIIRKGKNNKIVKKMSFISFMEERKLTPQTKNKPLRQEVLPANQGQE